MINLSELHTIHFDKNTDEIEVYNEDMLLVATCVITAKLLLDLAVSLGMPHPDHSHDDFAWGYLMDNVFGKALLMNSGVVDLLS